MSKKQLDSIQMFTGFFELLLRIHLSLSARIQSVRVQLVFDIKTIRVKMKFKNNLGLNKAKLTRVGFEPRTSGLSCQRSTN